jgi:hypothetical protein
MGLIWHFPHSQTLVIALINATSLGRWGFLRPGKSAKLVEMNSDQCYTPFPQHLPSLLPYRNVHRIGWAPMGLVEYMF